MKSLSPEAAEYLHEYAITPCMEYFCHVWTVAPSCHLEMLDKVQKWIYRTVYKSLAASLNHLRHY